MKIIRAVKTIEVKRTFVLADYLTERKHKGNNRAYLKALTEKEFEKRLKAAKKVVLKLAEQELDARVSPKWPKRLQTYNASDWHLAELSPHELGVWTRAGNLPLEWTNHTLADTARYVGRALERPTRRFRGRPRHAIPNILSLRVQREQREKYLYPIVFKGGTGTRGRRRLKRQTKADIDDGCMRSIALAVGGARTIRVYLGVPRRDPRVVHSKKA